jgi:ABC-type sugar transport system permease subunit
VLYLYRVSFKFFNLSYGSSIAIMTFLLILIPSLVQVKLMSKKEKDL